MRYKKLIEELKSYTRQKINCVNVYYDSVNNFPTTGKLNRTYIDKSTGFYYIWDGSNYVTADTNTNAQSNSFSTTITGDDVNSNFVINHNLNTNNVHFTIRDSSNGEEVLVDNFVIDNNNLRIEFGQAPLTGTTYNILISK